MVFGLSELAAAVRQFCKDNLPGRTPTRIRIYILEDRQPLQLPVLGTKTPSDGLEDVFVPNAFQAAILDALEGKALRTDALAAKVGDRSRLFSKPRGGLPELREQGLVGHHPRLGYYSVNAPPPDLSGPTD